MVMVLLLKPGLIKLMLDEHLSTSFFTCYFYEILATYHDKKFPGFVELNRFYMNIFLPFKQAVCPRRQLYVISITYWGISLGSNATGKKLRKLTLRCQ